MIDLSTKAGVMRFCELRRAEMIGCFEKLGRFESNGYAFGGFVFATHEMGRLTSNGAETGKRLPAITARSIDIPEGMLDLLSDPAREGTLFWAKMIRAYARATRARGVVQMTEAWCAPGTDADMKRPYGWIEQHTDRREALRLTLEHADFGTHDWLAWIQRDPTRLEPWIERQDILQSKGRLAHLLDWMQ